MQAYAWILELIIARYIVAFSELYNMKDQIQSQKVEPKKDSSLSVPLNARQRISYAVNATVIILLWQ